MQGTWPIKTMAEDMDSTYISHHNGALTLTIHYPGFQIYPFDVPSPLPSFWMVTFLALYLYNKATSFPKSLNL